MRLPYKKFVSKLLSAREFTRKSLPVQIRQKGVRYDPYVDEKDMHAMNIRYHRVTSGRAKMKKINADPEFRKRSLERLNTLNADPKFQRSRTNN
jgi:hypothetical protein